MLDCGYCFCHCRVLPDIGHLGVKDSKDQHEASALQDEVCFSFFF